MLQAARQGGAGVLGSLLTHWQGHGPREMVLCECGQRMTSQGRRAKGLLTTLGTVSFRRSFYQCQQCRQSRFPDDERLDIINTTYSPGVRRLMARAAKRSSSRPPETCFAMRVCRSSPGKSSAWPKPWADK